jgi:hypothetical protein
MQRGTFLQAALAAAAAQTLGTGTYVGGSTRIPSASRPGLTLDAHPGLWRHQCCTSRSRISGRCGLRCGLCNRAQTPAVLRTIAGKNGRRLFMVRKKL